MIKASYFLDALDKTFDIANLWINFRKQKIIDKILWINQNFENIDVLRGHILSCVDFKNQRVNEAYARKVLGYSSAKVKSIVELRANFLYAEFRNVQNEKIENKPLKIIVQELKLQGR